jgi:hypothetical protein
MALSFPIVRSWILNRRSREKGRVSEVSYFWNHSWKNLSCPTGTFLSITGGSEMRSLLYEIAIPAVFTPMATA